MIESRKTTNRRYFGKDLQTDADQRSKAQMNFETKSSNRFRSCVGLRFSKGNPQMNFQFVGRLQRRNFGVMLSTPGTVGNFWGVLGTPGKFFELLVNF